MLEGREAHLTRSEQPRQRRLGNRPAPSAPQRRPPGPSFGAGIFFLRQQQSLFVGNKLRRDPSVASEARPLGGKETCFDSHPDETGHQGSARTFTSLSDRGPRR